MTEVELKLQVSAAARPAIERALAGAPRQRLQAIYFDTADGRLAAAGLSLRLRKEGRRWVQTLKAGSAHGMARAEHNVPVAVSTGSTPEPDPARHHGTPPGAALAAVLARCDGKGGHEAGAILQPRYRTDIWRRLQRRRTRRGSLELAFDRGEIVAMGADGQARRWPVCELEIELESGSPQAVVELARRYAGSHGLWLDTRSKAERGERLARGFGLGDAVPAVKARPVGLVKGMTPAAAWAAVLDQVLAHALPNWSEVASGNSAGEPVHQLRVALRRLRTAQRFFAGWPGVPAVTWSEAAAALFRALGSLRDRDVLGGGLQPEVDAALAALGERALPLPAGSDAPVWDEPERSALGLVLIELCGELAAGEPTASGGRSQPSAGVAPRDAGEGGNDGASEGERGGAHQGREAAGDGTQTLRALAAERLGRWHRQVRRDAKRFDTLSDEQRHRLRKRLKRLRYAVEFCAGLFAPRAVERYLARLRRSQEHLGEFNDVCVAAAAYRPLAATEPRAWFALGWLAARRAAVLAECSDELQRLRNAKPFWP